MQGAFIKFHNAHQKSKRIPVLNLPTEMGCLSRAHNYQICICVSLTCVTNEPDFHFERTNQVLSENPAFLMFYMLVCTKL